VRERRKGGSFRAAQNGGIGRARTNLAHDEGVVDGQAVHVINAHGLELVCGGDGKGVQELAGEEDARGAMPDDGAN
jgi:hypothetical protein